MMIIPDEGAKNLVGLVFDREVLKNTCSNDTSCLKPVMWGETVKKAVCEKRKQTKTIRKNCTKACKTTYRNIVFSFTFL